MLPCMELDTQESLILYFPLSKASSYQYQLDAETIIFFNNFVSLWNYSADSKDIPTISQWGTIFVTLLIGRLI
jgi:hypothetical protein